MGGSGVGRVAVIGVEDIVDFLRFGVRSGVCSVRGRHRGGVVNGVVVLIGGGGVVAVASTRRSGGGSRAGLSRGHGAPRTAVPFGVSGVFETVVVGINVGVTVVVVVVFVVVGVWLVGVGGVGIINVGKFVDHVSVSIGVRVSVIVRFDVGSVLFGIIKFHRVVELGVVVILVLVVVGTARRGGRRISHILVNSGKKLIIVVALGGWERANSGVFGDVGSGGIWRVSIATV